MNPYKHSEISVKRWGGKIEDYYSIHQLVDCTKEVCSDNRHRILHTHWGIQRVIVPIVGDTIRNSDGKVVVIKDLCERDHILPDFRNKFIPTLADFVDAIDENQITGWKAKIEAIHKTYQGRQEIESLLLSPLTITGRLKSLLLTHNSWFINQIVRKIHNIDIQLRDYEIGIHEVFNNMRMMLWMDNGADLPESAKNINATQVEMSRNLH
ncbi:MAG: hypothetical protein AAF990_15885 [Bacteroidota bacterium]